MSVRTIWKYDIEKNKPFILYEVWKNPSHGRAVHLTVKREDFELTLLQSDVWFADSFHEEAELTKKVMKCFRLESLFLEYEEPTFCETCKETLWGKDKTHCFKCRRE